MLSDSLKTDTNCLASWRARPGSFVSLMSLYESNYIRLCWLIPDLASLDGAVVSHAPDDCALHLSLIERSRYTTTVRLTYLFDEVDGASADPDLHIRVYHDARLADVLSCAQWRQHGLLEALRSQLARNLGDRWLRNIMLNKWLDYCVERGHRFASRAS